ncbi:MAG: hypothetical protein WC916_07820 [Candidatus Woesearchaeota archaeon]
MKTMTNLLKTTIFTFVLFIAMIGFVQAVDTNESDNAKQALSIRYDHLACKVDFAAAQNDIITKYIGENIAITSAQEKVRSDLTQLEIYKNSNDQKGFDAYVQDTFKNDYKTLDKKIGDTKKDFKSYNLTNTSREAFKTDLKAAVKTYNECVSAKEIAMAKVAAKQYEHAETKWAKDIEQMKKKNMSVADVEAVQAEMNARLERLKELIASGNSTAIREYEKEMRSEHLHLWARFEEGRIKGYMKKVEAISGNDTRFKDLKEKLEEIGKYTAPGYKFKEGDADRVWDGLKNSTRELRETSKDIIKQRMETEKENRKQVNEDRKDDRESRTSNEQERMPARDGKRGQNSSNPQNSEDNTADGVKV